MTATESSDLTFKKFIIAGCALLGAAVLAMIGQMAMQGQLWHVPGIAWMLTTMCFGLPCAGAWLYRESFAPEGKLSAIILFASRTIFVVLAAVMVFTTYHEQYGGLMNAVVSLWAISIMAAIIFFPKAKWLHN